MPASVTMPAKNRTGHGLRPPALLHSLPVLQEMLLRNPGGFTGLYSLRWKIGVTPQFPGPSTHFYCSSFHFPFSKQPQQPVAR